MTSLRDAAFAVQATTGSIGFRDLRAAPLWPEPDTGLTVREFGGEWAKAGERLRKLEAGGADVWTHISRKTVAKQIRDRLRDPAIIDQNPTGLCGPLAIVFELIRRRPAEYVRAADELLTHGRYTTSGGLVIKAEQELREKPVGTDGSESIAEVDWLFAATMRDHANVHWDVDGNGYGIDSLTLWGAMSEWTMNVLNLNAHWETCWNWGELDCVRQAQAAVAAGGVAFLLIDSDLIADGTGEDENDMRWQKHVHKPGKGVTGSTKVIQSADDNAPPDHWVAFLGDLQLGDEDGPIKMRLWCWNGEYDVSGNADDFTEYMYAVVTGKP